MLRTFTGLGIALAISSAAMAQSPVLFELKFEPNSTHKQTVNIEMNQVLSLALPDMPAQDVETGVNNTVKTTTVLKERDSAGLMPMVVTIDSMQANLSLPGGLSVQYDSENPEAATAAGPVAFLKDIFAAITDVKLTYSLDDKNKAVMVTGAEQAIQSVDGMASQMLKGELNSERLMSEFNQEIGRLPEKPVKQGDSWHRKEVRHIGNGQTFTFEVDYTYEGTVEESGKTLHKVSAQPKSVTYEMSGDASPVKVNESNLDIKDWNGMFLYDKEMGRIVKEVSKGTIVGSMTLNANGNDIAGKLNLEMATTTTVTK